MIKTQKELIEKINSEGGCWKPSLNIYFTKDNFFSGTERIYAHSHGLSWKLTSSDVKNFYHNDEIYIRDTEKFIKSLNTLLETLEIKP